ncbi:MAG: monofunctional biosynthetic peptidoglycan transglycosylase [Mariprofundaceae bacterium]
MKYLHIRHVLFVALALMIAWHLWVFIQLFELRSENPPMSAFMQHALEKKRMGDPNARLNHQPLVYRSISSHLKRAVIASEDAAFTTHHGFDWNAIKSALENNLQAGRVMAGGSTISQQLTKNLFLSGERSMFRKGEEMIITAMLEATLSKQRILELYLNYAEWGDGVYGAEAAAQHHFGTSASRLTPWQAARLAVILPNPRFYDGNSTESMYKKAEVILKRMPSVSIPNEQM